MRFLLGADSHALIERSRSRTSSRRGNAMESALPQVLLHLPLSGVPVTARHDRPILVDVRVRLVRVLQHHVGKTPRLSRPHEYFGNILSIQADDKLEIEVYSGDVLIETAHTNFIGPRSYN